jgi:hypothetical protein
MLSRNMPEPAGTVSGLQADVETDGSSHGECTESIFVPWDSRDSEDGEEEDVPRDTLTATSHRLEHDLRTAGIPVIISPPSSPLLPPPHILPYRALVIRWVTVAFSGSPVLSSVQGKEINGMS